MQVNCVIEPRKCERSVRSHELYYMKEKPAIVRNLLLQLSLDLSDLAEKLDTGWFGGRC